MSALFVLHMLHIHTDADSNTRKTSLKKFGALLRGFVAVVAAFYTHSFLCLSGNFSLRHFSHKPASLTSGLPPALNPSVTDTQFGDWLCIWRLSSDLCFPSGNEYMEWYGSVVWTLSFIFNTLLPGGDSPVLSAVIAN